MKNILLLVLVIISISSCDQTITREFGGTTTINLPAGKKLINITWKENDLWYLTRDMSTIDSAQTYEFGESSTLGIAEGLVIIKETKK